jgi:uncharacterized protein YcbK (DUF882 family)
MIFKNQNKNDVIKFDITKCGNDMRIAEHFTLNEFQSRDGYPIILIHPALILLLENIRRHFAAPVHITSAFRTIEHNKKIGGRKDSLHLYGMAADIIVRNVSPFEVTYYARNQLDVGGVGHYRNFTHLDVFGENRNWFYSE